MGFERVLTKCWVLAKVIEFAFCILTSNRISMNNVLCVCSLKCIFFVHCICLCSDIPREKIERSALKQVGKQKFLALLTISGARHGTWMPRFASSPDHRAVGWILPALWTAA